MKALVASLAIAAFTACALQAGPADRGYVRGVILGWPARPQGGATVPAANALIYFTGSSSHQAGEATSDRMGSFGLSLPGGTYDVRVAAFGFDSAEVVAVNGRDTKTVAASVEVSVYHVTRLDLIVYTGIA